MLLPLVLSTHIYIFIQEFEPLKQLYIARGHQFVANALNSRPKIAELGHSFVQDGMVGR